MYEDIAKPLRESARSEPLAERAREMFTVPTEISVAEFNSLPQACKDFLTEAPALIYVSQGGKYVLNVGASSLSAAQKNRILQCRNVPNGIEWLRVTVDNPNNLATLEVHFFNTNYLDQIVARYNSNKTQAKNIFPISGGGRIRAGEATGQVQVDSSPASVPPAISMPNPNEPILKLRVKPIGDYSTYTLEIRASAVDSSNPPKIIFDPLFSEIRFKFRPGCFSVNCAPEWEASPAPLPAEPNIDYLAKDYESFRQTMIGAMMERVPEWEATSEADLDMVLLELFSVAADELSDYQDRVMNEAFFASSRKRVSLARHARLMDYHIHQGNQASTWLALEIDHETGQQEFEISEGLQVWAGGSVFDNNKNKPTETAVVFSSRQKEKQIIHQLLNSIGLYTWSNSITSLKAGSTQADLKLYNRLYLDGSSSPVEANSKTAAEAVEELIQTGKISRLLVEEHLNPTSGRLAGRNPAKRQMLRLLADKKGATAMFDPVENQWFVRVRWEKADALEHDYCFTVDCEEGKVENVSLFHGNLVEVFHGRTVMRIFREKGAPPFFNPANPVPANVKPYQPLEFSYERTRWGAICRLPEAALAYKKTAAGGDVPPLSTLVVNVIEPGGGNDLWDEMPSLIHSDDSDENGDHFVVETDENRKSLIRFGNGVNGKELSKNSFVLCFYQYGAPLEGNIGADSLVNFDVDSIVVSSGALQIRKCWNPFYVTDGKEREPMAEIIRRVPEAYRQRQLRAVTLADYVERAEKIEGVSRAAASYAWTGSWRTVRITIDPIGTNELSDELRRTVAEYLDAVRLIGEDIEIRPPKFVPLEIVVKVCAAPDFWIEDVRFVLEQEFSSSWTPDGRKGFFHPDLWFFGQTLDASQIIGRALAVKGVEHIISVEIKRWNASSTGTQSFTNVRANEIIEVMSDSNHLERGFIRFQVKGGRR